LSEEPTVEMISYRKRSSTRWALCGVGIRE